MMYEEEKGGRKRGQCNEWQLVWKKVGSVAPLPTRLIATEILLASTRQPYATSGYTTAKLALGIHGLSTRSPNH